MDSHEQIARIPKDVLLVIRLHRLLLALDTFRLTISLDLCHYDLLSCCHLYSHPYNSKNILTKALVPRRWPTRVRESARLRLPGTTGQSCGPHVLASSVQ